MIMHLEMFLTKIVYSLNIECNLEILTNKYDRHSVARRRVGVVTEGRKG